MPESPYRETIESGLPDASDYITKEQVEDFRGQLTPEFLKAFDSVPFKRKAIIVALYQKGYEELAAFVRSDTMGKKEASVVRHNVNFLFQAVPAFSKRWEQEE